MSVCLCFGQPLALFLSASGRDVCEAELKGRPASLERLYFESQAKIVENDARKFWQFNASGKMLRNVFLAEEPRPHSDRST